MVKKLLNTVGRNVSRNLVNYKGFKTNRKVVVIESDDWGSIRMPSKAVYDELLKAGHPVDKNPYSRNDSLATAEDLEHLFEVLSFFKDKKGNHPVITADTVVANPDFDRIRESGYSEYFYEPFTKTLEKSSAHQGAFGMWKEGMAQNVFFPQFHGREHVNVEYWMRELQNPDSESRKVFDYHCWLVQKRINGKINLQAALNTENAECIQSHKSILKEGLDLFEDIFGFRSKSYIANNFVFHSDLKPVLKENGVELFQGMKYQYHPILNGAKKEKIRHYMGEMNSLGQYYLVRNCVFEPSQKSVLFDNVGECLKDIQNAFYWKKPAIITAHRLNFIGNINPDNRKQNLKLFSDLLDQILKKWPDAEFMTSPQLGNLINESKGYA